MSLNVSLKCSGGGEPAGLPRASVRALFPVDPASERDNWRVRYDDANSCEMAVVPHASGAESVGSLCVHRPCGDERLWDALPEVLRLGPVVLRFPGRSWPTTRPPRTCSLH